MLGPERESVSVGAPARGSSGEKGATAGAAQPAVPASNLASGPGVCSSPTQARVPDPPPVCILLTLQHVGGPVLPSGLRARGRPPRGRALGTGPLPTEHPCGPRGPAGSGDGSSDSALPFLPPACSGWRTSAATGTSATRCWVGSGLDFQTPPLNCSETHRNVHQ